MLVRSATTRYGVTSTAPIRGPSPAGLAFAVYPTADLAPRAIDHHAWYRERLPDYPPDRPALVPHLLKT